MNGWPENLSLLNNFSQWGFRTCYISWGPIKAPLFPNYTLKWLKKYISQQMEVTYITFVTHKADFGKCGFSVWPRTLPTSAPQKQTLVSTGCPATLDQWRPSQRKRFFLSPSESGEVRPVHTHFRPPKSPVRLAHGAGEKSKYFVTGILSQERKHED